MLEMRDTSPEPAMVDPFDVPFGEERGSLQGVSTRPRTKEHPTSGHPAKTWVDPYPNGRMGPIPGHTTESIPARLDEMAPGPILAAFMASVDVSALSGYDLVTVLRTHQRLASHFQAAVYADMMALVEVLGQDETFEEACLDAEAEIRVALNLTRRSAEGELSSAIELHRRIPQVFEALSTGAIDVRRAKVFDRITSDLPIALARSIVDHVMDEAPHLTTGELAARLRKLRIEVDPDEATLRMEHAIEDRRVVVEPTPAGTANLHAFDLSPDRASSIMDLLSHTAKSLPPDGRSIDQKRADILLDLLDSPHEDAAPTRKGVVDLIVDLDTLAGLNDHAGELAGYGPVVADIARKVATKRTTSAWRYTVVEPDSDAVLDTGTIRRRPSAEQRRTVEARDRTCVFPGCRMPALASDLDHRIPWSESGRTATDDLAPLCRHCHRIRHRARWTYRRLTDGRPCWTTKLGHTYVVGTAGARSP